MSRERAQCRRQQAGAHIDHRDAGIGRQRIEDPHLVGDRGDVDDLGDVGMKALERALGRFGVEGARRDLMGGEIIQQRARDGGLADAAFVRADHDYRWLRHGSPSLTRRCEPHWEPREPRASTRPNRMRRVPCTCLYVVHIRRAVWKSARRQSQARSVRSSHPGANCDAIAASRDAVPKDPAIDLEQRGFLRPARSRYQAAPPTPRARTAAADRPRRR